MAGKECRSSSAARLVRSAAARAAWAEAGTSASRRALRASSANLTSEPLVPAIRSMCDVICEMCDVICAIWAVVDVEIPAAGRTWLAHPVVGRYQALEAFRAAARLAPDDPAPLYGQVEVGFHLGSDEGEGIARQALLRIFAIDPDTGRMTRRGFVKTGGATPRDFALDATGTLLYAANQDSNAVVPFRFDAASGVLAPAAAPAELLFIKQIGLGLAAAVIIDATIVRMVLVPATMELLGDANWWMPRWLDRIMPEVHIDGEAAVEAELQSLLAEEEVTA